MGGAFGRRFLWRTATAASQTGNFIEELTLAGFISRIWRTVGGVGFSAFEVRKNATSL
jgi:hypothetical protein